MFRKSSPVYKSNDVTETFFSLTRISEVDIVQQQKSSKKQHVLRRQQSTFHQLSEPLGKGQEFPMKKGDADAG